MKIIAILYLIFLGHFTYGQDISLVKHKIKFDTDFKLWTKSLSHFDLLDFKAVDTFHFENNYARDFKTIKEFLDVYEPVIAYSPDSSKFIDIYSYQLNLKKKENYYEANIVIDQAILMFDSKAKYWDRIFFGTNSQWIDEVAWLSETQFILVGIIKSDSNKRQPFILLGDTNRQTLIKYIDTNKEAFQIVNGYSSFKLKRIRIKGI
jgi:hypothetical protein